MKRKKIRPVFNVIIWDHNVDQVEFYDIMPYLYRCWTSDKKRRHKIWDYNHKYSEGGTRMPETFDEFKHFVNINCRYLFWAKSQYEIIVCGLPVKRNEQKIDAYEQIMQNIDVVTGLFMNSVLQNPK